MQIFYLVILGCLVAGIHGDKKFKIKSLPSFIKTCRRNADLSACALKHAKEVLPLVIKGDKSVNTPSLSPFLLDKVAMKHSNLEIELTKCSIRGIDKIQIKDIKLDLDNKKFAFEFFADEINVDSQYKANGQILVLPISGSGQAKINIYSATIPYSFTYDLTKRKDGNEYFTNIQPSIALKTTNATFYLDNLFNGNKDLGDNVNKLLNDNPVESLEEFGDLVTGVISNIATTVIKAYVTNIPYDQWVPLP